MSEHISQDYIGTLISMLRIKKGYDISELSDLSMISPQELIGIEQGKKIPSDKTFYLLAMNLGVYPENLLQGEVIYRRTYREIEKQLDQITKLLEEITEQNRIYMDIIDGLVAGYPELKEVLDDIQKQSEDQDKFPEKGTENITTQELNNDQNMTESQYLEFTKNETPSSDYQELKKEGIRL